jgi:hypothetical protein
MSEPTTFLETVAALSAKLTSPAHHLNEQRKNVDHHVGAQLHRLEVVARDCSHQISSAISAMSPDMRDKLDAFETRLPG